MCALLRLRSPLMAGVHHSSLRTGVFVALGFLVGYLSFSITEVTAQVPSMPTASVSVEVNPVHGEEDVSIAATFSQRQTKAVLAPADFESVLSEVTRLDLSASAKKRGDLSADQVIVQGADTDSRDEKFTMFPGKIPPEAVLGEEQVAHVNTTDKETSAVQVSLSSNPLEEGDWATAVRMLLWELGEDARSLFVATVANISNDAKQTDYGIPRITIPARRMDASDKLATKRNTEFNVGYDSWRQASELKPALSRHDRSNVVTGKGKYTPSVVLVPSIEIKKCGDKVDGKWTIKEGQIPRKCTFLLKDLSQPQGNITVEITGHAGTDLTLSSTSVTVTASDWDTEKDVKLSAKDDADFYDDEVTLTFTASGGGISVPIVANTVVRILDKDPVPVSLSAKTMEVKEGGTLELTVTPERPLTTTTPVKVPLKFEPGTSEGDGKDYDEVAEIPLLRSAPSATVVIQIREDDNDQDDEMFTISFGDLPSQLKEGTSTSVKVTIKDNDKPSVCLTVSPEDVTAGDEVTVTATIKPKQAGYDTTVPIIFINGDFVDPSTKPNMLKILKGSSSESATFKTRWKAGEMGQEKIIQVYMGKVTPEPERPTDVCERVSLTIRRPKAKPAITLSASPNRVDEGQPVTITAKISEAQSSDVTVPIVLTAGTAQVGDYGSLASITITGGGTTGTGTITTTDDNDPEADETFTVAIDENDSSFPSTVVAGDPKKVEVTITDNDTPEVDFDSSKGSVSEDGGTHDVKLNLSPAPGSDITLNYTLGGSATEDADYSITGSGTVSVDDGLTSVNIPVVITDDNVDDDAETIILTLESGTGYNLGSTSVHTLTITDNDTPEISFASATSSVGEGTGTHHVKVAISPAPGSDITLNYTLGGTATEDTDYSITGSGTVSVSAGAASVNIPVVITDDDVDDDAETIILTLASGTGYTVGSVNVHTLTITDNDGMPQVNFASAAGSVGEDGGTRDVEVSLSPAPGTALTLIYTLGGTATENADYSITGSGMISVAANASSVKIPVGIIEDTEHESDETVTLTLTSGTGYTVGSTNVHTLTIMDNDEKPQVSFASATGSVGEDDGTHHVAIAISSALAAPLTLNYTLGGTATENADYSITGSGTISVPAGATSVNIPIVITDDDVEENNEAVILTLTDGTEYTVGSANVHTLTITDNDEKPQVSFASSSSRAPENKGTHHVDVRINPAPVAPFTLSYGTGGTATRNTDYTSSGTISVATGRTSVNIPVVITDDDVEENNETVILTLESGTGYTVGSPGTHTLTIVDDVDSPDTPVTVSLSASPNPVDEGASVTITATLTEALPDAVTINLRDTPGEPPTEPGDYGPLPRITVAGGSRTGSGTLDIKDDDVSDGDERFTVAIIDDLPSGVVLGSPSSVQITITDNDPPPPVEVTLFASPNPVDEGKSVTITARLTGRLETNVVVPLAYPPSTAEPGDYRPLREVTILSGETQGSGQIQTSEDADMDDETFIVALGDLPPALLVAGRESSQSVTIQDVTSPTAVTVDLSASPDPVDEGGKITVTATLSEAPDTDVTIPLILTDGTTNAQDYEALPPTQIEIEAGERNGTYSISTIPDDIAETDETFTVALGTLPFGLVKGDRQLVKLTITDDDEAGMNVPRSVSVVEEQDETFPIALTSKPLGNVVVTMTWPSGTDLTVNPITRIFTSENWNETQQVSLRAADDADVVNDRVEVTLTASGSVDYTGISETVSVTITDNDAPGLAAPASVTMAEGSQRPLAIALAQMPSGPVTVTFGGHAGTDLALSGPTLPHVYNLGLECTPRRR